MATHWLTVQSFRRSQEVLAAINTLSIHIKLELDGVRDEGRTAAVARAKETLASFLFEMDRGTEEAELGDSKPLLGTDPRRSQLVKNFVAARQNRHRFRSVLFRNKLSSVPQLLNSEVREDRLSLLQCLEDLRTLLEEHVDVDAERILREI